MAILAIGSQKSLTVDIDSFNNNALIFSRPFDLKSKIAKFQVATPYHYKANFVVTAYTPRPCDNGGKSITYTGHIPRKGTIAVDPRIIPLGSKIYVDGYGWGVADDTGGRIRHRHIDVCLNSRHQVGRWGRKKMEIIVFPGKK